MSWRGTFRYLTPAGWIALVGGLVIAAALLAEAFAGGAW